MRRGPLTSTGLGLLLGLAGTVAGAGDLKDLYFGEALYYAYQGEYFDALARLDAELGQHYALDEPQLDSLQYHIGQAEFSVGDFELDYRMHLRAGRAISAVLEGAVDEAVRNEAAYRLARIHFQKDQPQEALAALDRISGQVPAQIADDVEFLRANVYLALGRPADAVEVLRRVSAGPDLDGFVAYNLGIALLEDGRHAEALEQLAKAGQVKGTDEATVSIRDKANLVRGTLLFEGSEFERAEQSFDRVHLKGPFSNQALLSAGWSEISAQNFDRALVPWGMLAERESTDAAVQEAMLALPYAYSKLNVHGRAAVLYARALETFGQELDKVDASIKSIRKGEFLKALVREEIRADRTWVIKLRSLPDAPETFYLMDLMASHDFQTALQNYLDLEDLRAKLESWQSSFDAFDDMIGLRRAYFDPVLPEVDAQFHELDSQIRLRLEQRKQLNQRLQHLLVAPDPTLLATADERVAREQLGHMVRSLGAASDARSVALRERAQRLLGVIEWQLRTEYDERLTTAHEHLRKLNADVDTLQASYDAFVRARQAAPHSYEGYSDPIRQMRRRVRDALKKVNVLMARQGHTIEVVAINELNERRERLETYQAEARYAVADSYDRAAKLAARGESQ